MTKVIVVLADGFEEMEAVSPIDLLRRAGASVTVVGLDKKEITSSRGLKVVCDTVLSEVAETGWNAVVLPGGQPGANNLHTSEKVSTIVMNTYNDGGYVCAICASPAVVLAPLGLLTGKKAVCYPGMEQGIENVKFSSGPVMNDARIITARGAGCATEFGLEIVSALFSREIADDLAFKIVY